jgi:tRNA dimethylallyltransferase
MTGGEPLGAILMGATATGKTAIAVAAAQQVPIEVISADSRQIYRRLDVGTAKPSAAERAAVVHHLVDCLDLDAHYDAAQFAADAIQLAVAIRARGRIPLITGGAGFYLKVLCEGLFTPPYTRAALLAVRRDLAAWATPALQAELARRDPERAAAIHAHDRYRVSRALEICIAAGRSVTALTAERTAPAHRFVRFRMQVERAELHRRIAARCASMWPDWVGEVERLLAEGVDARAPALRTLGYPHVVAHVQGRLSGAQAIAAIERDTRRFARHQETWFRKASDAMPLVAGDATAPATLAAALRAAFDV